MGDVTKCDGQTQIDYLLNIKSDRGICTNCKVIPSEWLSIQHRLLVIDLEIKRERKKREKTFNLRSGGEP